MVCRNPLSLDMGWKRYCTYYGVFEPVVAIRFRWIWVGREAALNNSNSNFPSQSAFAGYGLEDFKYIHRVFHFTCRNPLSLDMGWKSWNYHTVDKGLTVAIRFRWIWVGSDNKEEFEVDKGCRNPLSLDMGWKLKTN
mgnify:CR=1 FL=1